MSAELRIKPTFNDDDLKQAESRLDTIFHADRGTAEGQEAECLIALIQMYERDIDMTPKEASTFAEYLQNWGLRQSDIAKYVGGTPHASHLVKGTRHLTVSMMKALNSAYSMPFDQLMKFAAPPQKEWPASKTA